MSERKILYGVCGIGMGHTLRQQTIIDHFARNSTIVIFAYGDSYRHFQNRYRSAPNVHVVQVSVPFYMGGAEGLDFAGTATRPGNFTEDTLAINCNAMARAQAVLGRPDLVITDYEPVAAQYAYATGAPLVTIDQQSKYLIGQFPSLLHGQGFADEVQRLRMFFPRAEARFACSFFKVASPACKPPERVTIVPPVLSDAVLGMRRDRRATARGARDILVYVSSQREFSLSTMQIAAILAAQPTWRFHLFVPASAMPDDKALAALPGNVNVYRTGDARFYEVLQRCAGIITTAGHSLLSEAMYLHKPVYALPLPVYEQQMNAHTIEVNGFGIGRPHLTEPQLAEFLGGLPDFAANIRKDKKVLVRGSGDERIIRYLERRFFGLSEKRENF
jgi:uncharacterized protein (TIGR00661 family)